MKRTDCKNCELSKNDCGNHFSMNGVVNYDIPRQAACDQYGNCMFFKRKEVEMDIQKAMKIMQIEKTCVLRQDTADCNRDEYGCQCCDLIQDTEDVLAAYDVAIACIKFSQTMINTIVESMINTGCKTIEEFQKLLKAGDHHD